MTRPAYTISGIIIATAIPMFIACGGGGNTSSTSSDSRKWYEGGTLHQKPALDWQVATDADKLATCGDFVSKTWQDGNLKDAVAKDISNVDDIRPLAKALVAFIDNALKRDPDPTQNKKLYANQTVAETAAIGMVSLGWTK